jgi:hypothetical protein
MPMLNQTFHHLTKLNFRKSVISIIYYIRERAAYQTKCIRIYSIQHQIHHTIRMLNLRMTLIHEYLAIK